ncbi:hypothetical protein BSZ32_03355 [Rubritalea profundi]|uniref:RNA polymerase sigma-70 region 2 domain-containing protein n=1 Tax=Rubritalea profundi TaxID=1658618 RepID=A0A2S7TZD7_9BACT|nr:hypothetical protein BSZ32_03355 [Rubritalea profundi]
MKHRPPQQEAVFIGEITRIQSQLRAYIISLMPGASGAEDVLQETNLVLWEKRAKFEQGTNFRAWVCAIARLEVRRTGARCTGWEPRCWMKTWRISWRRHCRAMRKDPRSTSRFWSTALRACVSRSASWSSIATFQKGH